ncbi:unnamed protein product [Malus baccata var. baccata]
MRIHKLKMNPKKCAFGVRAGNFLGFLVHQRGVEVDKNKSRAILESPPPINKVQLQRLLGKINFLRRFIANLAGKIQPLTPLLRLKDKENFEWGPTHQQAFDSIKAYLNSPPVLQAKALYVTLSRAHHRQNRCDKVHVVETYASRKDWEVDSSIPQRAVKGQAIADFLTEHQESQSEVINIPGSLEVTSVWIPPRSDVSGKEDWIRQEIRRVTGLWITLWKLYFDGSHTQKAAGAGIVIINPQGVYHYYSFLLDYQENTNNRAEYEALIISLENLMDLGAAEVEIFGDSKLVINQLNGEFKCRHITMAGYYMAATQLLSFWESEISVNHIPRGSNLAANEMAQLASGVPMQERKYGVDVEIQTRNLPSILDRGFSLDVMVLETKMEDWRAPIIHHLKDPSSPTSKKNRQQATKYVLWAKNLLRKTPDGLLLKCLGQEESMRVMAKVHEGICGAHQAGTKMRWLLRRYGVPETIVTDCGPSFISKEVEEFASKYKIKMIQSSLYYPQSNGQAEASNKILVNIIKRMVIDSPEKWHEMLGVGTDTTPYALTFGQDAVLPMEINVSSIRIQNQFGLHSAEYVEAMCQGIEDLDAARIEALNQIKEGKTVVARAYNKKVKVKSFKEGDLVWKTVLPLGAQLRGFGKWSPT